MAVFLARRILMVVPVIFVVSVVTFTLAHFAPGGPFDRVGLGRRLPPELVANFERRFQLDQPVWKQYVHYMHGLVRGDLGPSYQYPGRGVREVLFDAQPGQPFWTSRFGRSAQLGLTAFTLACLVGIPLGVVCALRPGGWFDHFAVLTTTTAVTVPGFIVGLFLMVIFGVELRWFPVLTTDYSDWRAWVLPAFTLALPLLAYLVRLTRASLREHLQQDYVRTARAKGAPRLVVVVRHALRNSWIPIVTVLGPGLASFVVGSFVVEYVFAFPGMGQFFVQGVTARDYPMIMAMTLLYATLIVLANLLVDIAYVLLDPRVRLI